MQPGFVPVVVVVALVLAACDQVSSILPTSAVDCDGTEAALCQQVARLGVAQMNLAATGPITGVTLQAADCEQLGQANFHGDWRNADACWSLVVTGERSHGWGFVVLWPNGDLQPFW